jgi:RNA polymerase sigma factor (sigma-70 family)
VTDVAAAVAAAFRTEWGRIVAQLIRVTGDWDLAEEAAQDAFAAALSRWPRDGVPDRPGAWLTTTARNRAVDRIRREALGSTKLKELAMLTGPPEPFLDDSGVADDRLRLIFTCCHPALGFEAQVALTLRTLAGLTTTEIARAFLVPEATMSKRLLRAKNKIRNARIPYRVPPAHLLPERTTAVLGVLYLLFNEGYAASAGAELVRRPLSAEAVRLARLLAELMPDEAEVLGLLALLLLHDSRRTTRVGADGVLVPLEEQDRGRWDRGLVAEGTGLLETALRRRRPGPYQVQAAIAACHVTAATPEQTDWAQIAALYAELVRFVPSAVVELNHAVAVGMAFGPAAGLELVDALAGSGRLDGYHLLPATRADLLRRLDRRTEAAEAYRAAIELAGTEPERRYLEKRAAQVSRAAGTDRRVGTSHHFACEGDTTMEMVTSKDGTTIAYDRVGAGPALVLVSGASVDRGGDAGFVPPFAENFTVYNYDRRGRGDSSDTAPYAAEREIEDLDAVIAAAGGSAAVIGFSSGGALAARAAAAGSPIGKLVLWEVPYALDDDAPRRHRAYVDDLNKALDAGDRGAAAERFMRLVGLPEEMIAGMRQSPYWPGMEAIAPTLLYDAAVMGDSTVPADRLGGIGVPTLVLDGGASPQFLRDASTEIAAAIPNAERRTLEGQDHNVAPDVIVPVVTDFLTK